ncbi:chemotaxis protein CheB [Paraflavisolibacter sp. H34]|uniref:chemotaxis protein CheB n=1 Tax=Huijunlia imazamoxiresistens TaxID=3127457 RepID=UPI003015B3C1
MNHYIIAIGGSAGCLEALTAFFEQSVSGPASYVILRHLPQNYQSQLKSILERYTGLPIVEVDRAMPLQAGTIYIGPCHKDLVIFEGALQLVAKEGTDRGFPSSIDLFFQSLAAMDIDKRAIAIVLSGAGWDGTKGTGWIKQAGGLVIAQAPSSCIHRSMPEHAIEGGHVDHIEVPGEIPWVIRDYMRRTG